MRHFMIMICGLICSLNVYAISADTLQIHSPSMDRTLYAAVVLPSSYFDHDKPLPVIYLLHGATGNFSSWLNQLPDGTTIQRLADAYDIIFVMPEGDTFSFYIDSPWNPQSQFETHIVGEVIPLIDNTYRTLDMKSGRAITGLSMGGHGALYLATRNPQLFAAAGSMSGAVDIDISSWNLPPENTRGFMAQLGQALGADNLDPDFLTNHSVTNLVEKMKENGMPLIIDCGVDDFLLEANRALNQRLLEAQVPHDYIERPGAHTWSYWQNALPYQVLFISEVFRTEGP